MLTGLFKDFALLGAEWVMWVLVALSVVSIGVMIERGIFFSKRRIDVAALAADLRKALRDGGDEAGVRKRWGQSPAMPALVAIKGLSERGRGVDAVAEAMNEEKGRARQEHERYLVILGTLGNNAPFIGLFGTVLGVIGAFERLRQAGGGGAGDAVESTHGSLSEALVATAVGLLVAIPAVVAFNYFNRRVRAAIAGTDEIAHVVLNELHARDRSAGEGA
ncbi:MAG TPA: MotA/TolQ/ExbB proton channel family protein [Kofleriaceae bacterium]|nr:MotA/TolQ/ExbB proton channel family protein [Kofleriaceae bacterium]